LKNKSNIISTISKELLQRQLHKGLEAARQRWENCPED